MHVGFQVMVGLGLLLAFTALWSGWAMLRTGEVASHRRLLRMLVIAAPCGFLATEAGWIVTEVGRQPWTVQGLLRTADAVTPMPGLPFSLGLITLIYLGLSAIVLAVIASMVRETRSA